MVERRVEPAQVHYIIDHGSVRYKAGAMWYVLRKNDIPPDDRFQKSAARLVELLVCVEHGAVATVFWHQNPARYVNQKPLHYRPKRKAEVVYMWEVEGRVA